MNALYTLDSSPVRGVPEALPKVPDDAPVKLKDPIQFYRSLAFLYKSGHPISNSFRLLAAGMEDPVSRLACLRVFVAIRSGRNLSQSFQAAGFPHSLTAAVKAGEHSGRLDDALVWYADYQERNDAIKRQLQQAFLYPVITLGFALSLALLMPPFVLKDQLEILESSGTALPLVSQALLHFSKLVTNPTFLLVIPALWMVAVLMKNVLDSEQGRLRLESLLLSLPIVGAGLRRASGTRSLALFTLLMRSGVSVLKSLEVAAEGCGSPTLSRRLVKAGLRMQSGATFLQAMEYTEWYLPASMNLLAAGEATGDMAGLSGLASQLEEEAFRDQLHRFAAVLQPAMLLFVGVLVCLTIMAVLGPSLTLIQGI